jgi:hypothetical protein
MLHLTEKDLERHPELALAVGKALAQAEGPASRQDAGPRTGGRHGGGVTLLAALLGVLLFPLGIILLAAARMVRPPGRRKR